MSSKKSYIVDVQGEGSNEAAGYYGFTTFTTDLLGVADSMAKLSGCDYFCRNQLELMISSGVEMWFWSVCISRLLLVGLVGCRKTKLSCAMDPSDHNRLEMGENTETVSDGVLQVKGWCLNFNLNFSTVLSKQSVLIR